jgi:hypothetical protein
MLLLWIVLGSAIAETPRPSPPSVPVSVTLPDGVSVAPVARELVSSSRSSAVMFTVSGRPSIEDGLLKVTGVLKNEGRKQARVFLADEPHTGGPFVLVPRGAVYNGTKTEGTRSPMELSLPPGGQVVYESGLVLTDWTWPEGGAEVDWQFQFWTEPVAGTIPGKLSPPK